VAKPVTVFTGVSGLNTKEHPARLAVSQEGIAELAEAVNIDISDRYKPRRRKGQKSTSVTMPVHSLYSVGDFALCVSGSTLYLLSTAFTLAPLRNDLMPGISLSYAELAGKAFYANGYQSGYVDIGAGEHHAWETPITQYEAVDSSRRFSDPPVGHLLTSFAGRVWIAQDNVLWATEPYAPLMVDMARNAIPFSSRITALSPLMDGILVSTRRKIVFVRGTKLEEMIQVPIADYPAIPGTLVQGMAEDVADLVAQGLSGPVVIMATTQGICVAGPGGYFRNLTHRKLDMPLASRGAAYIYDGKYVVSLQ
jgi:hypothetical protein